MKDLARRAASLVDLTTALIPATTRSASTLASTIYLLDPQHHPSDTAAGICVGGSPSPQGEGLSLPRSSTTPSARSSVGPARPMTTVNPDRDSLALALSPSVFPDRRPVGPVVAVGDSEQLIRPAVLAETKGPR